MATWNYRVLRYPNGGLVLHEVYYNDAGLPDGWTEDAASFGADDEDGVFGILASLERAMGDAEKLPPLQIVKDGDRERLEPIG
jgi:hypothetical protein